MNCQLADINISNSYFRTAQSNSKESGMNDHHPMCEPHQQDYSQLVMYYDDYNVERRDDIISSVAQNPHLMSDFHQFLNFTQARSAQESFQPIYNRQTNQGQKEIPSIFNIKTNIQHKSSTPKRVRPLNDSGESISSIPKQNKANEGTPTQREAVTTTDQHQRKSLLFNQLKRTVSSSLPCSSSILSYPIDHNGFRRPLKLDIFLKNISTNKTSTFVIFL